MNKVKIIKFLDDISVDTISQFYEFCDFVDGGSLGGSQFKSQKNNLEINDPIHSKALNEYTQKCFDVCTEFHDIYLPRCWTRPKFLKYTEGMHYDYHNDFYEMNGVRTDYSATCFLNSPEEYEGGELILNFGNGEVPFKLNRGECVIYPTGTWHKVNPIISGERRAMVFWVESWIGDSRVRSCVQELSELLYREKEKIINSTEINGMDLVGRLEGIRYQLIREFTG